MIAAYGPSLARNIHADLIWRIECGDEPSLYLTFDDGPTRHLTPRILDVLDRNDVRATFFLLGKHLTGSPGAVKSIEDGGHRIGLHGFDHLDAWSVDLPTILADLNRGFADLSSQVSSPLRFFRPPYGRFRKATRRWARENQLAIVMWDVMPGDFMAGVSAGKIVSRVIRRVRNGSIIVLHDSWNPHVVQNTVASLETMLPILKDEGWRFEIL